MTRLPERWRESQPALRAVQVAFDVSQEVLEAVRTAAFRSNRSTSDQIRDILGLPLPAQAKRPRLTVTLSADDYALLGSRYGIAADDALAIKQRVLAELVAYARQQTATGRLPGRREARHPQSRPSQE